MKGDNMLSEEELTDYLNIRDYFFGLKAESISEPMRTMYGAYLAQAKRIESLELTDKTRKLLLDTQIKQEGSYLDLEAENKRYREALEKIEKMNWYEGRHMTVASEALKPANQGGDKT